EGLAKFTRDPDQSGPLAPSNDAGSGSYARGALLRYRHRARSCVCLAPAPMQTGGITRRGRRMDTRGRNTNLGIAFVRSLTMLLPSSWQIVDRESSATSRSHCAPGRRKPFREGPTSCRRWRYAHAQAVGYRAQPRQATALERTRLQFAKNALEGVV